MQTVHGAVEEMKRAMVDCGVPMEKIREVMKLYKERHPWRSRILRSDRHPGIVFPGDRQPTQEELLATADKPRLSEETKDRIREASKRFAEQGDDEGEITAGSPETLKAFGELPTPEFIAHDWCGFLDRYGRFTHLPSGQTLICEAHMDQEKWDRAQLRWFRQFSGTLVVHRCPVGPYRETGDSMGTVAEIIEKLKARL